MATLLIETKEVRALEIQFDDLEKLLKAVHKKVVFVVRKTMRGEVLVDAGRYTQGKLSADKDHALWEELTEPMPFLSLELAIEDLVNRGELPEGHFLVNLGEKVDEFASGGIVRPGVLALQKALAEVPA